MPPMIVDLVVSKIPKMSTIDTGWAGRAGPGPELVPRGAPAAPPSPEPAQAIGMLMSSSGAGRPCISSRAVRAEVV